MAPNGFSNVSAGYSGSHLRGQRVEYDKRLQYDYSRDLYFIDDGYKRVWCDREGQPICTEDWSKYQPVQWSSTYVQGVQQGVQQEASTSVKKEKKKRHNISTRRVMNSRLRNYLHRK